MARRRYPSDIARLRSKPAVRVHLSVSNHRKTAEVWADLELRAMLVELWRLAAEKYAGRTGDTVLLTAGDIRSVTGRERGGAGLARLRHLCGAMGYTLSHDGRTVSVTIRNFAKKQGWHSAESGATPRDSAGIKSESESESEEEEEHPPTGGDTADAASLDRALRLLSREPGSPDAKRAWMERELPLLLAESERMEPVNKKARSAAFRSLSLRYWRQHCNGKAREFGPSKRFDRPPTVDEIRAAMSRQGGSRT